MKQPLFGVEPAGVELGREFGSSAPTAPSPSKSKDLYTRFSAPCLAAVSYGPNSGDRGGSVSPPSALVSTSRQAKRVSGDRVRTYRSNELETALKKQLQQGWQGQEAPSGSPPDAGVTPRPAVEGNPAAFRDRNAGSTSIKDALRERRRFPRVRSGRCLESGM